MTRWGINCCLQNCSIHTRDEFEEHIQLIGIRLCMPLASTHSFLHKQWIKVREIYWTLPVSYRGFLLDKHSRKMGISVMKKVFESYSQVGGQIFRYYMHIYYFVYYYPSKMTSQMKAPKVGDHIPFVKNGWILSGANFP